VEAFIYPQKSEKEENVTKNTYGYSDNEKEET
jgi:hypothetical protein